MSTQRANLSFADACASYLSFRRAVEFIRAIIEITNRCPNIVAQLFPFLEKDANQFMEYQRPETMVLRPFDSDHVFPLETVAIQQFNREHGAEIEHAAVHTGPLADEFARSLNALAVTVGQDIYFRDNAYNPTDEEGRKLLVHELTHVAQHDEGRVNRQNAKENLEAEAETAEAQEAHETDTFVTVEARGERFTMRASRMKKVSTEVAKDIEEWVERQKDYLDEERYLELLVAYRDWIREAI